MSTQLTKDARGFVDGVVTYLKSDARSKMAVPKVQAFLQKVTAQTKKQKVASVESSVLLTSGEKTALARALARFIGHEVEIEDRVNSDLIGGIRISVGDWMVDTSLSMYLEEMGQSLQY